MLPRLFSLLGLSSVTTIALAADGIAVCEAGQSPELLVSANTCYESRLSLINALKSVADNIKAKQVRFVISNHFVRYGVLPWQTGISSRQDWLALAQHDFRKRFGATAEQWQVRMSLNGYRQSVATCAIDQALLDDLYALAKAQQWHISAIEPLLFSVLAQPNVKKNTQSENVWLVIAEPERVLLCEANGAEWQKFTVISPPGGQESQQTAQQIARSIQTTVPENKLPRQTPKEVVACLSPTLFNQSQSWHSDAVNLRVLPMSRSTSQNASHSALWMACL